MLDQVSFWYFQLHLIFLRLPNNHHSTLHFQTKENRNAFIMNWKVRVKMTKSAILTPLCGRTIACSQQGLGCVSLSPLCITQFQFDVEMEGYTDKMINCSLWFNYAHWPRLGGPTQYCKAIGKEQFFRPVGMNLLCAAHFNSSSRVSS